MSLVACAVGLGLVFVVPAFAQDWTGSTGPSAGLDSLTGAQLRFQRMLNTFTWAGGANVIVEEGPWNVHATQSFQSRLIRSGRSLRQDEYRGSIVAERSLTQAWSLMMQEHSSMVSGPAGVDLGEVSQHRLLGGARWGTKASPNVTGAVGWEWNRQLGRNDAGLSGIVSGELPAMTWEEVLVAGRGNWSASRLGERRPSDAEAELSLRRPFAVGTEYALTALFETHRRDLPAVGTGLAGETGAGAGALLRRGEDVAAIRQSISWSIDPSLRGVVDAGWSSRQIERRYSLDGGPLPAGIRQSVLEALGRMHWQPTAGWWNEISLRFGQGEEQHEIFDEPGSDPTTVDDQRRQARRRNHQTQRLVLSVRSGWALTEATDLDVSASSNILRYDTPDTLNTDDRDELVLSASAEVVHRWGSRVTLHLLVDGAVDHLVFLSRFQSANNVTVRTLRLAPAVVWRTPGGIRNILRSEVAASYSAFDFEDQVGGVQSYSYRQAMWSDSLIVPLGDPVQLEFTGSLRLFERGLLRWSDFRERPERAFTELALWPRIRLVRWMVGSVAVGYRSFRQERYAIVDGHRSFDGALGSSGPTVDVEWEWRAARVALTGWRETQRADGRTVAVISNVWLQVRTPL